MTAAEINVADLAASNAFITALFTKTLTITSGGEIRNSTNDFNISADGVFINQITSSVHEAGRTLSFGVGDSSAFIRVDTRGDNVFEILGAPDVFFSFQSQQGLVLGFESQNLLFDGASNTGNGTVGGANGYIDVKINGNARRIALYDAP